MSNFISLEQTLLIINGYPSIHTKTNRKQQEQTPQMKMYQTSRANRYQQKKKKQAGTNSAKFIISYPPPLSTILPTTLLTISEYKECVVSLWSFNSEFQKFKLAFNFCCKEWRKETHDLQRQAWLKETLSVCGSNPAAGDSLDNWKTTFLGDEQPFFCNERRWRNSCCYC